MRAFVIVITSLYENSRIVGEIEIYDFVVRMKFSV